MASTVARWMFPALFAAVVTATESVETMAAGPVVGAAGRVSPSTIAGSVQSFRPFVTVFENFLTPTECDHVIELTKANPLYNESKPTNTLYFSRIQGKYADPLLHRIEDKVASILGWPDHALQESLCVHRIAADPTSPTRLVNVHHDKANKPYTAGTVIVYLQDVEDGGETIFPCDSSREVQNACVEAFSKGARWYNGERTVLEGETHWAGQDNTGQVSFLDDTLAFLRNSTSTLCSQRNHTGFHKRVLAIKPRRGTAAFFRHDIAGGASWSNPCCCGGLINQFVVPGSFVQVMSVENLACTSGTCIPKSPQSVRLPLFFVRRRQRWLGRRRPAGMAYGLQGVRGCEVDDAEIRGNSWTVPPPFAASAVVSEVIEGVGTLHVN